jgi:hypothetical protein
MAPLLIALLVATTATLFLIGANSLPETVRMKDGETPAEGQLALRGLGILAVMFLAMGGVLVLAANVSLVGDALLPQALAR